jgi:hypothetical protein
MQELAPEQIIVEVLTVDAKGSGQKQVTATARVMQVNRTNVGLSNGSDVTIRYEIPATASTAPEFPRLLKVGEVTPAFLKLKGNAFAPAARHHTFVPMLPQQVKRMNQQPVDPNLPPYQGAGSSVYAVNEDPRKIEQYVQQASAYAVPTIEMPDTEPVTYSVGLPTEKTTDQTIPPVEPPPAPSAAERQETISRRNSLGEDQYQDPTLQKDAFAPSEKDEIAPVAIDSLPIFEPYRPAAPRPEAPGKTPAAPAQTGENLSNAQTGPKTDRMVLAANVPGTETLQATDPVPQPPPTPKAKPASPKSTPPQSPEPLKQQEPVPTPVPQAAKEPEPAPQPASTPAAPAPKKAKKPKPAPPTPAAPEPSTAKIEPAQPAPPPAPSKQAQPVPAAAQAPVPQDEPIEIKAVPPTPESSAPPSAPVETPAPDSTKALSDYADIYGLIKKGEQLQIEGKKDEAGSTYTQALKSLLLLRTDNPDFQPFMVEYRIRDLKRKLEALKPK